MAGVGKNLPEWTKKKVIHYADEGNSTVKIVRLLQEKDDITTTRQSVWMILKKWKETGSTNSRPRPSNAKVRPIHKDFINLCYEENPESTTQTIRGKLKAVFDLEVSDCHLRKIRDELGWKKPTNVGYCQMISKKNKDVRVSWCNDMLGAGETFSNVIFTDETTVELNACGRIRYYKEEASLDCLPRKAPKPKHAYKVHVWGGISVKGRTSCCAFTGIMDSLTYQQILADNLLPFARRKFPDGFRLYQDNDSKHRSKSTQDWFRQVGISHCVMTTPASSPDLNPIENVWADMKRHLRDVVKPRTKDQLVEGIFNYWTMLSVEKCTRFVDHIHKVMPHVILNHGGPTVY